MIRIKDLNLVCSREELKAIPEGKVLINTINAFSFNNARKDEVFAEALLKGDYLIPDGASIVKACRWLKAKTQPKERIAGWDLFEFEMHNLQRLSEERKVKSEEYDSPESAKGGLTERSRLVIKDGADKRNEVNLETSEAPETWNLKPETTTKRKPVVMFAGSSEKVLSLIKQKAAEVYPGLEIVTYSPPYKPEFSDEDNKAIIDAINAADPDLLWIGMTAPKQEKWTYTHWDELNIHCHVGTVGAVFDFFAGTYKRAPQWWQDHSLEWLYRLLKEPKRMWRRYIIGNAEFLVNVIKETL